MLIDDIDCDGDLDIISFQEEGNYVTFYQNQAIELDYGVDSLIFLENSRCWGGFLEGGNTGEIALSASPEGCADNLLDNDQNYKSTLHAGSTLLTLDIDNDQDRDLLISDVGLLDVSLLQNGGDCDNAWMNDHIQNFPPYDTAANLGFFPAVYKLDLDQDGIEDLVYAPNFISSSSSRALWFYKNTVSNETPIYELKNKHFLIDQMIDVGLGANPYFVDYNADGLLDIILGNLGYRLASGGLDSRLTLFENVGTAKNPEFELVDEDYLGFSRFFGQARDFTPAFGDMDSDGDLDLVVGSSFGKILFAENLAGPNAPFEFGEVNTDWFRIRAGQFTTPFIFDINGDGLNDLLIGQRLGNINYFQNVGTTESPEFLPNPNTPPNLNFFGRIDTRQIGMITGTSAPVLVVVEGTLHLITGSEQGSLELYEVNLEDLSGEFEAKSLFFGEIKEGFITRPSVADINNDGWYDILVGNKRGGISLYTSDLRSRPDTTTSISQVVRSKVNIFPNPTQELIQIQLEDWQKFQQIKLFNANGKLVCVVEIESEYTQIPVDMLERGLHFVQLNGKRHTLMKKILLL